jgi:hypothetical protein
MASTSSPQKPSHAVAIAGDEQRRLLQLCSIEKKASGGRLPYQGETGAALRGAERGSFVGAPSQARYDDSVNAA